MNYFTGKHNLMRCRIGLNTIADHWIIVGMKGGNNNVKKALGQRVMPIVAEVSMTREKIWF
jgi:hypothetical protein